MATRGLGEAGQGTGNSRTDTLGMAGESGGVSGVPSTELSARMPHIANQDARDSKKTGGVNLKWQVDNQLRCLRLKQAQM